MIEPVWCLIDSTLLYVHRNHVAYYGLGTQDGHLDFHTVSELWQHQTYWFNSALRPQKPRGLLVGTGAQDGHLNFHTAPELWGLVPRTKVFSRLVNRTSAVSSYTSSAPRGLNGVWNKISSLRILMQVSLWWWQCSDRYIISLFPHLHLSVPNKPYGFGGRKAAWKKKKAPRKKTSVRFRFGSPFSSKIVVYGFCLCDLAPHNHF